MSGATIEAMTSVAAATSLRILQHFTNPAPSQSLAVFHLKNALSNGLIQLMNLTNKQFAKILRDVAEKIEKISDASENGRKQLLKQYKRIPIPAEFSQESIKAFLDGFEGKLKKPRSQKRGTN